MADEPPSSPGVPGPSSDAVKRVPDDSPVPLSWLQDADFQSNNERLDRLAADVELVTSLALAGYAGPEWDYFENELAKYGMAVIGAWMRKRLILGKCRTKGFGGLPDLDRDFDYDEVDELTGETVATALRYFRNDVLMRNRWDARRGATLRTFFIGQCLLRFANVYRRWYGNEVRNQLADMSGDKLVVLAGAAPDDTARTATDRHTIEAALASVPNPHVRRAMLLTALGVKQAEIAYELGVTEKAVERMLAHQRQRLGRRAG